MKTLWIIANWKSNNTIEKALEWVNQIGPKLVLPPDLKVVVCPQMSEVSEIKKLVQEKGYPLMVGVEDLSPFGEGAYTGEVAAATLKGIADLAILGHSERRKYFQESDQLVVQKTLQAKEHGIIPLVCVQNEQTPIPKECELVAFEPVFAIGSGTPDTPENANTVAEHIKSQNGWVSEVLYGGSVNSQNCVSFVAQKEISGLLVGKASLESEEFLKIIQNCISFINQ